MLNLNDSGTTLLVDRIVDSSKMFSIGDHVLGDVMWATK